MLFLSVLVFVTTVTRGSPNYARFVYTITPTCYRFGDCLDKMNEENFYFINMHKYFLIDIANDVNDAFGPIERKLKIDRKPSPATESYVPLKACWPTDWDMRQPAAEGFSRKMYAAYVLSDTAKYAGYRLKILYENIARRLHAVSAAINATSRAKAKTVDVCAFRGKPAYRNEPDNACHRNEDCIDDGNYDNELAFNNSRCYFAEANETVDAKLRAVEKAVGINYVASDSEPVIPVEECSPSLEDVSSDIYLSKIEMARALADKAKAAYIITRSSVVKILTRLQKINEKLF